MNEKISREEIKDIYNKPFISLLHEAQNIHREHHIANTIQLSTLLSIKTGACPEDCNYCSQSAHFNTDLEKEKLAKYLAKNEFFKREFIFVRRRGGVVS